MKKYLIPAFALFALILGSCSSPTPPADFLAHNLGERRSDFDYGVNLGSDPKDVYFLLTNTKSVEQIGTVTVSSEAAAASLIENESMAARLNALTAAAAADGMKPVLKDAFGLVKPELPLERYRDAARAVDQAKVAGVEPKGGVRAPNTDYVGQTKTFYGDDPITVNMPSTCRWISGASLVTFPDGKQRKLSIWVENDETQITDAMVNALAARFFGSPAGNGDSIYHWVTNMLGDEWGNVNYTDLTEFDSCITILLCDIEDDNSTNGGIVGYYAPKNNFTDEAAIQSTYYGEHSNERMMFFIDSAMYANASNDGSDTDPTWEVTDYWPEEVFSTLAHEFQHMIAFYRISVVGGDDNTTWFTELCSQVVEDLVADKIGVMGPRGVDPADFTAGSPGNDEGRIPYFNNSTGLGLIDGWEYSSWTLYGYAQSYSFGSYLIRNYGGADFMRKVFLASGTPEERVEQVSGKPFKDLLAYWSMAVMLSDRTDAPAGLVLNRGASFDSVVGDLTYQLGSINHYNYIAGSLVGPGIVSTTNIATIDWYHGYGTWFCRAGAGQTDEQKYSIKVGLDDGVGVSVIAK